MKGIFLMRSKVKSIVSIILVLLTILGVVSVTSFAAKGDATIYLTPNANWLKDNARFALYTWIDGGDYHWIDMTDDDGDGVYQATLPGGYTNIIFCRMDPNKPNGWSDNKTWNQTNDLIYDGVNNHYTIGSDAWSNGEGKWSVYDSNACAHKYDENSICTKCGAELFYIVAGYLYKNGDVYAEGDNTTIFGSKWDVTDENNRMKYDPAYGCYVIIYENVAKGEYAFKVAENKSWDVSYGDDGDNCHLVVEEDGSMVVITLKDGKVTFASDRIDAPEDPEQKPDDAPDGEMDSEENNEPPVKKLNFFQKIWLAITNFFKKLFGMK
jgi:hypothetical protein